MRRVRGPDGREWEISTYRVRLPSWPQSDFDPWDESGDLFFGVVAFFVLAPFFWFVLPLVQVLLKLPVAVGRSFFSSTRWVEAVCRHPAEIRIRWRTSRRHAERVADDVARLLEKGYEGLRNVDGATFEFMSEPPGSGDLYA